MAHRLTIPFLALVGLLLGTTQFGVVGILEAIAASTGVSVAAAGQLMTAFSLAGAVATPAVAIAAARVGRRTLLVASMAVVVLGCLAPLAWPGFAALLAGRVLQGAGMGVFYVTALAVATTLAPPGRQAGAIGTVAMGFGTSLVVHLGLAAGAALGGVVAGGGHMVAIGWTGAVTAALAALVAVLAFRLAATAPGAAPAAARPASAGSGP